MSDAPARLIQCFEAAFPDLPVDAMPNARAENVEGWDSLASLTLIALLEEEFDLQISDLDFPELRSFAAVRDYLRKEERLP